MNKIRKNLPYIATVVLFICIVIWFLVSAGNAGSAAGNEQTKSVYRTIMNGAALCYSIEGEYPPSLEYLEEHYGVRVDRERYAVDYRYFGANVRPTVTIAEKGGAE